MDEKIKQAWDKRLLDELQEELEEIDLPVSQTEPLYYEVMVPMRDGVKLNTYYYVPKEEGRFPVIFTRGCYPYMDTINKARGRELAKRGYVYAYQSCRGVGGSEGKWTPNENERNDGYDAVEWIVQQEWAGSIGLYGESYLALTGWAFADIVQPQVKTMYLGNYGVDRYSSVYKDGLLRHDVITSWSMENTGFPVQADYMETCRFRPHVQVDEKLWGKRVDWYRDMVTNTRREDEYWQTGFWHTLRNVPGNIHIPIYIGENWYDHHFGSAVYSYEQLSEESREHSSLVVGGLNHFGQCCLQDRVTAHVKLNSMAAMLEWFEMTLKQGKLPPKRIQTYEIGADGWREWTDWPLPTTGAIKMFFAMEETQNLSLTETPREGKTSFIYDPENPVPSHGAESMLHTQEAIGSLKQPEPGWREDVLSFVSVPMAEDVNILGEIKVRLTVSSDAEDTSFTAKVMEVFPDGRAYNIRSTITTIAAWNEKYIPGEKAQIELNMWPIDWLLKKGSRIRVDVSSSDFPQYAIHSNYPGVWSEQEHIRIAKQTIYQTAAGVSELILPTWDGEVISK